MLEVNLKGAILINSTLVSFFFVQNKEQSSQCFPTLILVVCLHNALAPGFWVS